MCYKGIRKYATFDTKVQAQLWAAQIESAILNNENEVSKDIEYNHALTIVDLFERYKTTVSPLKSGFRWERIRLVSLMRGSMFMVHYLKLTNKVIIKWRDKRLMEVKSSTVNREMNLISAVINHSIKEWMIDFPNNPVHIGKKTTQS